MRSRVICMAVFLALSGPALAQTQVAPAASSACSRSPHMGEHNRSAELIAAHHAMRQACAADEARFCANVPKGCGQEKQCMMTHQAQLSSTCASAWQNLRATRHHA